METAWLRLTAVAESAEKVLMTTNGYTSENPVDNVTYFMFGPGGVVKFNQIKAGTALYDYKFNFLCIVEESPEIILQALRAIRGTSEHSQPQQETQAESSSDTSSTEARI